MTISGLVTHPYSDQKNDERALPKSLTTTTGMHYYYSRVRLSPSCVCRVWTQPPTLKIGTHTHSYIRDHIPYAIQQPPLLRSADATIVILYTTYQVLVRTHFDKSSLWRHHVLWNSTGGLTERCGNKVALYPVGRFSISRSGGLVVFLVFFFQVQVVAVRISPVFLRKGCLLIKRLTTATTIVRVTYTLV